MGRRQLSERGASRRRLIGDLKERRAEDSPWHGPKLFWPAYFAGDDVFEVAVEAYNQFIGENGLYGRTTFPSLYRMEEEVIDVLLGFVEAPDLGYGNLTSGGTEGILMAVKTARDWAREFLPRAKAPELIVPYTAHPAFSKAAHICGVTEVRMPSSSDYRADVQSMADAINEDTIMLVASAPPYPYGIVDPIEEIASVSRSHGLWMHVDACLGGFVLPFVERLGRTVPEWNFRVPGVDSITIDLHKYSYCVKGVSSLLFRDSAREPYQRFTFDDWPSGTYSTANVTGSRPGGGVVSAWAVMNYLGLSGYLDVTRRIMAIRDELIEAIDSIDELQSIGLPHSFHFAFAAPEIDIDAVADGMEDKGWRQPRGSTPAMIQLVLNLGHEGVVADYVDDLSNVVKQVKRGAIQNRKKKAVYAI